MAGLTASERATFILTDGERLSGVVVFHTEERTNIRADKQEFNVGVTDGREVPIPFDHVAVIDFVGGQPGNDELAALTDDSAHTMVMRNGNSVRGRLVDLIAGERVKWTDANGTTREVPIREVRRVYLNNASARTVFNYNGPAGTAADRGITPATQSTTGRMQASREVEVRADTPWNDTGITVSSGQRLAFSASGKIGFGQGLAATAGPDGNNEYRRSNYPVRDMPVGALIGKVGNGAPFIIGSNTQPIVMNGNGRLMLAVNDEYYQDNEGAFRVTITRAR
jgi:hypothetical protein